MGTASAALVDADNGKNTDAKKVEWPLTESDITPKICMMCSPTADEKAVRSIKQLGIKYVNASGITSGWKEKNFVQRWNV
jgi:hypothetical protein